MKKKCLIASLLVSALCLSLSSCGDPSAAVPGTPPPGGAPSASGGAEVYHLRMSTLHTSGTPGFEYCNWFIDRVAELTDGNVSIELFPGSQLGDYTATYGELIAGSLDLSWESVAAEYDIRLQIMGAPYVVTNWDEVKYAYTTDSWLGQYMGAIHESQGVKELGIAPGGFYGVGGKDVGALDTLFDTSVPQRVLCRVPPQSVSVATMEALNFTPTTINYSDLYSALQTGVANCWYGGSVDLNYDNFRDVITYYVAYNYTNEWFPLLMSQASLDKLPQEYQDAIVQAGQEATSAAYDIVYENYYGYFDKLKEAGITIIEPTEAEMAEMSEDVRDVVWAQLEGEIGSEDIQGLRDFVEQMHADLAD